MCGFRVSSRGELSGDRVDDADVEVLDEQDDAGSLVGSADPDVVHSALANVIEGPDSWRVAWHQSLRQPPDRLRPLPPGGEAPGGGRAEDPKNGDVVIRGHAFIQNIHRATSSL